MIPAWATITCLFLVQIFVQTSTYARTYHTPKMMLFHFWLNVSVKKSLSLSVYVSLICVLITRYDDFKLIMALFTMNWSIINPWYLPWCLIGNYNWFWVQNGSTSGWDIKQHIVNIALLSSLYAISGHAQMEPPPPTHKPQILNLCIFFVILCTLVHRTMVYGKLWPFCIWRYYWRLVNVLLINFYLLKMCIGFVSKRSWLNVDYSFPFLKLS